MYNRVALRQGFLDHYEHVRSVVPPENLLEFKPQDGWEPLCTFLGKEVPDEPFPHINDADSLIKLMRSIYWILVISVLAKLAVPIAGIGAVVAGVWWAMGNGLKLGLVENLNFTRAISVSLLKLIEAYVEFDKREKYTRSTRSEKCT
jgi:hypothetical protein